MPGQGHLHAVPGGEVFVYDLPASQVAHPACNLDSHVDQVLLRDRLKGNEGKREKDNETGKIKEKKVRSVERRAEMMRFYHAQTALITLELWGKKCEDYFGL